MNTSQTQGSCISRGSRGLSLILTSVEVQKGSKGVQIGFELRLSKRDLKESQAAWRGPRVSRGIKRGPSWVYEEIKLVKGVQGPRETREYKGVLQGDKGESNGVLQGPRD